MSTSVGQIKRNQQKTVIKIRKKEKKVEPEEVRITTLVG